jgi:hypothetical protein
MNDFRATGFRAAAEYVTEDPRGSTLFYDGYGNGAFVFWVRKFDKDRKTIVLRGDKLLTSSAIFDWRDLKIHVRSTEEIYDIFRRFGTTYVVVEKYDKAGIPVRAMLREMLKTGKFRMVKELPIETSDPELKGQSILIYERLEGPVAPYGELVLPLPIVGKEIKLPIEDLVQDGTRKRR